MIFVVFFGLAIICVALFLISDYILYVQHERHIETWEADDRPFGIFYFPKEVRTPFTRRFGSWFSSQKRLISLGFKTPEWARTEQAIINLLIVYRILQVSGLLLWIVFAYLNLTRYR